MHLCSLTSIAKHIGSFIAAMPALFYIRKIFRLSVELKKFLAWKRNIRIRLLWNAFPCVFPCMHLIAWSFIHRAHHFLAATAFTIYLPLTSPPHSWPYPACNAAANFLTDQHVFNRSLPRLDMTFLRIEIISFQDNIYPLFSSCLFRGKTPQITVKDQIRSSLYMNKHISQNIQKTLIFIRIIGAPECLVVCGYKARNLTIFCAFEFTCAWQSRLLFTKMHLLYFFPFRRLLYFYLSFTLLRLFLGNKKDRKFPVFFC